jgi:hypothetical protein
MRVENSYYLPSLNSKKVKNGDLIETKLEGKKS